MMDTSKYSIGYYPAPGAHYKWVQKDHIEKAPQWCSVDLRDGNQALVEPLVVEEKLEMFNLLVKMGCTIEVEAGNVVVQGPKEGKLKGGFTVDMSSFSDQALTLAAIAPFANAPISIKGIGHIRMQECDRIHAIVQNLTALGIKVEEQEAEVTIYPGEVRGADIETFDDHRVAMSFALTGLRADGVKIKNPMCCRKTFAEYFEVLEQIITQVTEV